MDSSLNVLYPDRALYYSVLCVHTPSARQSDSVICDDFPFLNLASNKWKDSIRELVSVIIRLG